MVDGELDGDQHRGAERGDRDDGRAAAAGRRPATASATTRDLDDGLQPAERVRLAPDAERRVAVDLLGRSCGRQKVAQARVERRKQTSRTRPREGDRERRRARCAYRGARSPLIAVGREQRRQRQRGELRQPTASASVLPRATGGEVRQKSAAATSSARPGSRCEFDSQREGGVRVGGPGEGEHDAELGPAAAPAQPPAEQEERRRIVARSKTIAAACAAGRSSQLPLHGQRLLERDVGVVGDRPVGVAGAVVVGERSP